MATLPGLLDERNQQLRGRARSAVEDLRAELAAFGAAAEDLETLRQAARDLDELFLLVVVGEFNSGKSALINALLGADLLPEGVTPTTTSIQIVRHGREGTERWLSEHLLEREHDAPLLRDVAIVDTPGTNAILRHHQELTERFVPRADLVLFVTSAERPFTESERAFLESIRAWGKKIVLVINKRDLLRGEEELQQVLEFVGENVQALLGFRPPTFPVSARTARESAPSEPDPQFLRFSRFIGETLSAENRVKLKLASPLGVAQRIAEKYDGVARDRLELLAEDARTGDSIESQLEYYRSDARSQSEYQLQGVDNLVYELGERADRFFDETFRLARVFDLINSDKIRGDFERQVLAGTSERIEAHVDAIAGGMIDREIQLWRSAMDELARRRRVRPDEVVLGEVGDDFEQSRGKLIQNVTQSARRVVAGFDREAEARALGDTMREAVAHTALAEVGAVGLGTLTAVLVGTAAADISGILAGSLLAGLGLYIIPARKQRVQKQFRTRTDQLRARLRESISKQLQTELSASVERIQSAIAPYLRFVRSEQEKVTGFHETLLRLGDRMGALRREIGSPSFEGE